jgi:hypothetical protein
MKFNYLTTFAILLTGAIQTFAAPVNIAEPSELLIRELVEQELEARAEYDSILARELFDIESELEARAGKTSTSSDIRVDPVTGVKQSGNPKDWPTTAQIEKALVPPKNGAWFWSGRKGSASGESVEGMANQLAQKTGGITLELAVKKAGFIMPIPGTPNSVWQTAATTFAKNAVGEVNVLLGESMRQGSTWERAEFPALKSSKKVTKVVAHHPMSPGKEQVIWPLKGSKI